MLQIDRKRDNRVIRAFTHKIADIPDGVTVSVADLTQKVLSEGTPVGKDTATGLYHVVKVAKLTAVATNAATNYVVEKGHNFKVGDFVALKEGGKAYAITEINTTTSTTTDTITVGTTLGVAAAIGDAIYHAAAEATGTESALKYKPVALVGESYDVKAGSNLVVNAWTIAQIREDNIPTLGPVVKAKLTGIQFI
jgi:hypothetical protein